MQAELVVTIDKANWNEGLSNARERGQYDGWLLRWRVPVEVETLDNGWRKVTEADWERLVAYCQRSGWLISTVIDPLCRPIAFASPQFPAPGDPAYPCTEI